MNLDSGEIVILIHGLARTHRSMSKMGRILATAGFLPILLRYPSRKHQLEKLADNFIVPEIQRILASTQRPVHFVTHSMGGILLRIVLLELPTERIGRSVMLAPPNHGSEIVDKMRKHAWFRHFFGPAALELCTADGILPKQLPPLPPRCGIIAGDRSAFHLFDSTLPGPHDGTVSVASTKEEGAEAHIILHTSHPFIMSTSEVIENTVYFLQYGRFLTK